MTHERLQKFFAELAARLDVARKLEREFDRRLAHRFSAFKYLRNDEIGLSRIIADLLDPVAAHGQGTSFLRAFLDKTDINSVDNALNIDGYRASVKVQTEHGADEGRSTLVSKTSNYPSSMARYNASRSSMSTRRPPLSHVGNGGDASGGFPVANCGASTRRRPASTSADIVVPRRAASSRNRRMTESSMLRVVFTWKTVPRHDRQPPTPLEESPSASATKSCLAPRVTRDRREGDADTLKRDWRA